MLVDKIQVEVNVDSKKAREDVKKLKSEISGIESEFENVNVGSKEFSKLITELESKTKKFVKTASPGELIKKQKELNKEYLKADQGTKEFKRIKAQLDLINPKVKDLKDQQRGFNKRVRNTGKAFKSLESPINKIKNLLGGLIAGFSIGAINSYVQESIKLFQVQEKADAQLRVAIESTNAIAGKTFDELKKKASELQSVSLFGDEEINKAQSLLLTFTNIRDTTFDNTTETILDVATGMAKANDTAIDLRGTTVQIGKALNDPIKGISSLTKVGVQFTEQQKGVIKSLVDTGKTAEAQAIILKELNTQFGGSAAAAANTVTGRIQQQQNTIADLREEIGQKLLPLYEIFTNSQLQFTEAISFGIDFIKQNKNVLIALVGVYATYKAAVIASTAAEKLLSLEKKLATIITNRQTAAETIAGKSKLKLSNITGILRKAMKLLNTTLLTNPFTLLAVAAGLLIGYMVSLYQSNKDFRAQIDGLINVAKVWFNALYDGFVIIKDSLIGVVTAVQSFANSFGVTGKSIKKFATTATGYVRSFAEYLFFVPNKMLELYSFVLSALGVDIEGIKESFTKAFNEGYEASIRASLGVGDLETKIKDTQTKTDELKDKLSKVGDNQPQKLKLNAELKIANREAEILNRQLELTNLLAQFNETATDSIFAQAIRQEVEELNAELETLNAETVKLDVEIDDEKVCDKAKKTGEKAGGKLGETTKKAAETKLSDLYDGLNVNEAVEVLRGKLAEQIKILNESDDVKVKLNALAEIGKIKAEIKKVRDVVAQEFEVNTGLDADAPETIEPVTTGENGEPLQITNTEADNYDQQLETLKLFKRAEIDIVSEAEEFITKTKKQHRAERNEDLFAQLDTITSYAKQYIAAFNDIANSIFEIQNNRLEKQQEAERKNFEQQQQQEIEDFEQQKEKDLEIFDEEQQLKAERINENIQDQTNRNFELNQLDAERANEIKRFEGEKDEFLKAQEKKKFEFDKQQEKKQKDVLNKQAKVKRAFLIADTVATVASAIIKAKADLLAFTPKVIPPGVPNPAFIAQGIAVGLQIGSLIASKAVQLSQIKKLRKGSYVSASGTPTKAPKSNSGIMGGSSHEAGGNIVIDSATGQPLYEAEKGEGYVFNKDIVSNNRPLMNMLVDPNLRGEVTNHPDFQKYLFSIAKTVQPPEPNYEIVRSITVQNKVPVSQSNNSNINNADLAKEIVNAMQGGLSNIRAYVVTSELEAKIKEKNEIEDMSAL